MQELKCPNCGGATKAEGDKHICLGPCGGSFKFRDGDAKLVGVGEFEKLRTELDETKEEVKALREQIGGVEPDLDPEGEPGPDDKDEW